MKFTIIFVFLFGSLAVYSIRANDTAIWKGLSFDVSTVEDAIRVSGKPSKRRTEKMKVVDEKTGKVAGTKDIQSIEFRNIDGWKKVSLGFLDGTLFKAKFWPKNRTLAAASLPVTYMMDFVAVEGFAKGVPLSVFEGKKEPEVPRVFPVVYFMVSAGSERFLICRIHNGFWKPLFKEALGKPTVELFPGYVEEIEIISRGREGQIK